MSNYDFHMQGSRRKGVLLIHGLTGSPSEMRFVGKQLHRAGFTVYAPTLAGHCGTKADLLVTTFEDWVESVRVAIRQFVLEVEEVYLAGICVGGAIGLYAAADEPSVKGVAIYSPLLKYDGWNTPFYYNLGPSGIPIVRHIPLLNKMSFGESAPYGLKSERIRNAIIGKGDGIEGTLDRFPLISLYENIRLNNALCLRLPDIYIPTLLIHAREDDVCHPRNAIAVKKLHGGPCEIAWLEDSYHMIHVDQERHKVAQMTAEFFGLPEMETQKIGNEQAISYA